MKKTLLLAAAGLCAMMSANADTTVKVTADHPERVKAYYEVFDYDTYERVPHIVEFNEEGVGEISVPDGQNFMIKPTDSSLYIIDSVTNAGSDEIRQNSWGEAYYYFYPSSDADLTVTTKSLDDMRDKTVTINVDDASKVYFSANYNQRTLQTGENTLKYADDLDLPFQFKPNPTYGYVLNRVERNGEALPHNPGDHYTLNASDVADGDVFNVVSIFPEGNFTVNFVAPEGIDLNDALNVYIAGSQFEGNLAEAQEIANGTLLNISYNSNFYVLPDNNYIVNGDTIASNYGSTYVEVRENTTIEVPLRAKQTYTGRILTNDPEAFAKLYVGASSSPAVFTLDDNNQWAYQAKWLEDNPYFTMTMAAHHSIVSVTCDGDTLQPASSYNQYQYELQPDKDIFIETKADVKEGDFAYVAYFGEMTPDYISLYRQDSSYESLNVAGIYNELVTFPVYPTDSYAMTLGVSAYSVTLPFTGLYRNNEAVAPMWAGSTNYQIAEVKAGDVLKFFGTAEPNADDCIQFYTDNDGAEDSYDKVDLANEVRVVADKVKPIAYDPDYDIFSYEFPGTLLEISTDYAPEDVYFDVWDYDENWQYTEGEIKPVYDEAAGCFTYTTDDVFYKMINVYVKKGATTGVKNVVAEGAEVSDLNIFNLQGIRVAADGNRANLPAGIYIQGGRKFIVR